METPSDPKVKGISEVLQDGMSKEGSQQQANHIGKVTTIKQDEKNEK